MSYLVSARKWRPQKFEEVIGQKHIVRTLTNALKEKRIASAYLFSGMRGVGKTTTARILAKALNCAGGISPQPCNECESCKEITRGFNPDVLEIDGASNTGVDDIRDLRENVQYVPSRGRYKIYIIDEVHMLSNSAFNALLKTLEEPPAHVLFVFATTDPQKIPETISSRCQCFEFKRLFFADLIKQLQFIADKEGIKIDRNSLFMIARAAEGSLRDAEMFLDQLIAYSGKEIKEEDVFNVLGLVASEKIELLLEKIIAKKTVKVLELFQEIKQYGRDYKLFCRELMEYIHNLVLVKFSPSLVNLPSEKIEFLKIQSSKVTLSALEQFFELIRKTENELRFTSIPEIVLEMSLIRMSGEQIVSSGDDLSEKNKKEEKGLLPQENSGTDSGVHSIQVKRSNDKDNGIPSVSVKEYAAETNNIQDTWDRIRAKVSEKKHHLGFILERGIILKLNREVLEIGFKTQDSFYREQTEKMGNMVYLKEAAKDILGKEIIVNTRNISGQTLISESDNNFKTNQEKNGREKEIQMDKILFQKELVDNILEVFDGSVVSEREKRYNF